MITNNRTEIATALRELKHETYYNEEIVDNICDAINIADPTNTFRTPEDIYNLLADLIDPTCYLECIETTPKGAEEWELDWKWQCSNCTMLHKKILWYRQLTTNKTKMIRLYYYQ